MAKAGKSKSKVQGPKSKVKELQLGSIEIRRLPIARINPAPYNPRTDLQPGDPAYEKLRQSILSFNYIDPVVWNQRTGHLVGGHQRFKVLVNEGVKTIDVSVVDLPLEREKVLNIRLNKAAGEFDREKFDAVMAEIAAMSTEALELTGFDAASIEAEFNEQLDAKGGGKRSRKEVSFTATEGAAEEEGPTYTIDFDDETQRQTWKQYLRWLKRKHPKAPTLAARLILEVSQRMKG